MTKNKLHQSSIIEKFTKKDNFCNICGQAKVLSDDHVPPKVCPSAKNTVISKLLYQMTGDKSFRPRISQNGITFKTICSDCNNWLGSKYDWALGEFANKVEGFIQSNLILPDSFEVECQPNAIIRSILGHILAAKTQTDNVVIDQLIRTCILDDSLPIHDDIHVFYWVYPYEKTVILRDFGMPAVRGRFDVPGFFNMIKFYPIAFLATHRLPEYENLDSLSQFNKLSPNDKANIPIRLSPLRNATWPEQCDMENFLMVGRAANDSVYAVSKSKTVKNFKPI
jgi:hypothetical protein